MVTVTYSDPWPEVMGALLGCLLILVAVEALIAYARWAAAQGTDDDE